MEKDRRARNDTGAAANYETAPQSRYPENLLFASAVERLYELDTNRTRTLLLEEMKRPDPRLPYRTLAMIADATLPELDATLLDHLQHNGGPPGPRTHCALFHEIDSCPVEGLLRKARRRDEVAINTNPERRRTGLRASAGCIFPPRRSRLGRKGASPIARRARLHDGPMGLLGIIGRTAVFNSGPVWERVAIDALQDPAVPVKIDAVKSLAQYGSPAAKPAIFTPFATGTNGGRAAGNRMRKATASNRHSSRPRRVLKTGLQPTPTLPPFATCA